MVSISKFILGFLEKKTWADLSEYVWCFLTVLNLFDDAKFDILQASC